MLRLIFLLSIFLSSINGFETHPPSPSHQSADISGKDPSKNGEQPVAIEGQFIVPEGNADHLFRPYDFVKEEAIRLGEGDTKNTEKAFV